MKHKQLYNLCQARHAGCRKRNWGDCICSKTNEHDDQHRCPCGCVWGEANTVSEDVGECVFCEYVKRGVLPGHGIEGGVLMREQGGVMLIVPPDPVIPGHFLFVPVEHVERPHQSPFTASRVFGVAAEWINENEFPTYNLIMSSGKSATQTIFHMHLHYVPRYEGDGLKLPWGPH